MLKEGCSLGRPHPGGRNLRQVNAVQTAVVSTRLPDGAAAGRDLCEQIRANLSAEPEAIIVFAAPTYDHEAFLATLKSGCGNAVIVGASSAGEFANRDLGEGLATALALRGEDVRFSAGVGRGLHGDTATAAREIAKGLRGLSNDSFPYRSALVMTDALAGYADALVDELTLATAGQYQFFGGGAGDNANFQRTTVFCDTEVMTDAAVALEILSTKPLGIGVSHGWEPASAPYRVTEADGLRLVSLNGFPTADAFHAHAEANSQTLDPEAPIPFFLHNILGIDTGAGYRLRVPLAILEDGSVLCAAEVPVGSMVRIMQSSAASAVEAAERATDAALAGLRDSKPEAALLFDCVATRLRLGDQFAAQVAAVADRLGEIGLVGCNTHGQIARAEGQFHGFHNCTAVVCVFPA